MDVQNQFELNNALLHAITAFDLAEAEQLLNAGADPLGSADSRHPNDCLLSRLFEEMLDNDDLADALPAFLQLFYAHGMDIATWQHTANAEKSIHPLWLLAFGEREADLTILQTMIENGLDRDSATVLIHHLWLDMQLFAEYESDDDAFLAGAACGIRMTMLIASYPDMLSQITDLQDCILLAKNDAAKLPLFRHWEDFDCCIDRSTCTDLPHSLQNATVIIRSQHNKEPVWKLQV